MVPLTLVRPCNPQHKTKDLAPPGDRGVGGGVFPLCPHFRFLRLTENIHTEIMPSKKLKTIFESKALKDIEAALSIETGPYTGTKNRVFDNSGHRRRTQSTIKPLTRVQAMLLWQDQLFKYGWAGPFSYANQRITNRRTLIGVLKEDNREFLAIEDSAEHYLKKIEYGEMPLRVQESLRHYAINRTIDTKTISASREAKNGDKNVRSNATNEKKDLNNE